MLVTVYPELLKDGSLFISLIYCIYKRLKYMLTPEVINRKNQRWEKYKNLEIHIVVFWSSGDLGEILRGTDFKKL